MSEHQEPVLLPGADDDAIVYAPSPLPPPRRSGCLQFVVGGIGCLLLIMAIVFVPPLIGITSIFTLVGGLLDTQPPSARVYSSQTIITRIQPLGQLVSMSVQVAKADIGVNINQGALNECGFGAQHVAQGAIEAGVNLFNVADEDITYNEADNSYTLRLPPAELTSCRIDFIRQYERTSTLCNVDWDEARILAGYSALTGFRDDALEGGLLVQAQREADNIIINLVQALTGAADVRIVRDENAELAVPASCNPDVPAGWVFDSAAGTWVKQ